MAITSGSSRSSNKAKIMQLVLGFIRKHGRRHGTSPKDVRAYLMKAHAMTESQAKKATGVCLKRGLQFGILARKRNLFSLQVCSVPPEDRGRRSRRGRGRSRRGRGRGKSNKGRGRRSRRGRGHSRRRSRRGRKRSKGKGKGRHSGRGSGRRSRRGRKGRGRRSHSGGSRRDSTEPEISMVKQLVNRCFFLVGRSQEADTSSSHRKPSS